MKTHDSDRAQAVVAIGRIHGYQHRSGNTLVRESVPDDAFDRNVLRSQFSVNALIDASDIYGFGVIESILKAGYEFTVTRRAT